MRSQLLFSCLLEKALKDWPSSITFSKLHRYNLESSSYSLSHLSPIEDEIDEKYIEHEEAIIWRNLHSSIYGALHAIAEFVIKVSLSELRPETIKKKFDLKMKDTLEDEDLGWSEQDIALVKEYFRVNEEYEATLEVEEYEAGYWKRWPNKAAKDRGDKPTMVLDQW